jgi:lipoyl(octanoyl) transferase
VTLTEDIVVRRLGRVAYQPTWQAMRDFTRARSETTPDELWLLEHPPVYTLGQGARAAAVANGIALVRTDRGGEITYHGPGQAVLYTLVDLARRDIKVKRFVAILEDAVMELIGPRAARRGGGRGGGG